MCLAFNGFFSVELMLLCCACSRQIYASGDGLCFFFLNEMEELPIEAAQLL